MRRRILPLAMAAMLAVGAYGPPVWGASASDAGFSVYVDGKQQTLSGIANAGQIPARQVFEAMGYQVTLSDGVLEVTNGLDRIRFTAGSKDVMVTGSRGDFTVTMMFPAVAAGDDLLVEPSVIRETEGSRVTVAEDKVTVGTHDKEEWWYSYPTQEDLEWEDQTDSAAVRGNFGADFGWGLYTQRLSYEEYANKQAEIQQRGQRLLGYMEGSGTVGSYVEAYPSTPDGNYTQMFPANPDKGLPSAKSGGSNVWSLFYHKNNNNLAALQALPYRTFTGVHSDINSELIVQPNYTAAATGLDAAVIAYPDGSSAEGYLDATDNLPYPLNAKLYDAVCSKGQDGNLWVSLEQEFAGEPQTDVQRELVKGFVKATVGSPLLPEKGGAQPGDVFYYGMTSLAKDTAAPFWQTYNDISLANMVNFGLDGLWVDNYSMFDNFSGTNNRFGDWSEALFNEYLQQQFTPQELAAMGIADLDSFNIREHMNTSPRPQNDPAWLDDPVWNAYKVFKQQTGATYLQNLYSSAKRHAREAGKTDGFLVMGNDVNVLNHGWVQGGWLDMAATELSTTWNLAMGSRGMGRPDEGGRMGAMYRTLTQTAKGPYAAPWLYAGDYANKTELGKVWLAEAFANGAFVKAANNTAGTVQSHQWLNDFAHANEEKLAPRYEAGDVAVVFSTASQLAAFYPNNAQSNVDDDLHFQGLLGFSHFFIDNNIPYNVLPEWKLNAATLANYQTVILPSVEAMDEETATLLAEYVYNGGRLVVTGASGLRTTQNGNFERYAQNPLNSLVGQDVSSGVKTGDTYTKTDTPQQYTNTYGSGSVVWTKEPVGHEYYIDRERRGALTDVMFALAGDGMHDIIDASALAADKVGAYTWDNVDQTKRYVDLVNYNVDADNDVVSPRGPMTFKLAAPQGSGEVHFTAISPDTDAEIPVTASYDGATGMYSVTVPYMNVYTIVIAERIPEPPVEDDGYQAQLSNEFEDAALTGWHWLRGNNAQVSDGHLNIHSYVEGANGWENVLLSNQVVTGDFACIVRVKPNAWGVNQRSVGIRLCRPNAAGTMGDPAGHYAYFVVGNKVQNPSNGEWVQRLVIDHDGTKGAYPDATMGPDGYLYLKVERKGDLFYLSYSADGETYTPELVNGKDYVEPGLGDTIQLGLFAQMTEGYWDGTYPTGPEDERNFTANFDYVRLYQPQVKIGTAGFYVDDQPIYHVGAGQYTVTAKLPYSDATQLPAALLLALYRDTDEGRVLTKCRALPTTLDGEGELAVDMAIDIPLDEAGQYSLALYTWDSLAGMKPLAACTLLPE